jgi:hypothetical protein
MDPLILNTAIAVVPPVHTCDAIMISERVDAYTWLIQACVDLTPGFELSNIKVIYADGIHAGETLLHLLGIKTSCRINS